MFKYLILVSMTFCLNSFAETSTITAIGGTKDGRPYSLELKFVWNDEKATLAITTTESEVNSFRETYSLLSEEQGVLIPQGTTDSKMTETGKYRVNLKTGSARATYFALKGILSLGSRAVDIQSSPDQSEVISYKVRTELGNAECVMSDTNIENKR